MRGNEDACGEPLLATELGWAQLLCPTGDYDEKLIEGEVIVYNNAVAPALRVVPRLSASEFATLLKYDEERLYIPRIEMGESRILPFCVASLLDNIVLNVSLQYEMEHRSHEECTIIQCRPNPHHRQRQSVFVSYSRQDLPTIRPIVLVIKRCGVRAWIAEHDLSPEAWFPEWIKSAIASSNMFVVFLSSSSLGSPWVRSEVSLATDRIRLGSMRGAIPVLIEPVVVPEVLAACSPIDMTVDRSKALVNLIARLRGEISDNSFC